MSQKDNFYQILNLTQSCSAQEIKDSFIELSKKYHPDKSKDKEHHAAFVKINEAYSVLGKPLTRRLYDKHLDDNRIRPYHHYYENVYTTRNDSAFWANRAKGTGFTNEPYYGIKGLKKVPNSVIVLVCFVFAAVGLGVEVMALNKSLTFDREKLRHDSARNHMIWEYAKQQAEANGNREQIEKFKRNSLHGASLREMNEVYRLRLIKEQLKATEEE